MPDPTQVEIIGPQNTTVVGSPQRITTIIFERIGPRGADGTDGAAFNIVTDEVPGGGIDGINTTFTTAQAISAGQLMVYLNGLRMHEASDYDLISSTSFEMLEAPLAGDNLTIDYVRE